ncbi:MAG: phospholipase D family protein [bacterium]|nr:phospholipase D family protein [bacterium]
MEILDTTALSHEIEKLIKGSEDLIIIISPYLKINNRLRPKLAACFSRNNKNLILYREDQLLKDEKKWLDGFTNVKLIPIKHLHAKCYLNEKTALIATMNLYEYSQINNHEIGIKISVDNDKEEMNELLEIINTMIKTDHPTFDFSSFHSIGIEYTMGGLYGDLIKEYEFPGKSQRVDGTYEYMCQIATKYHKFDKPAFKLDNSALKRITPIDSKTYWKLRNEIIKKGQRKH